MLALLVILISTSSAQAQSCKKQSQVATLQAICDEAKKQPEPQQVRCESTSPATRATGPTLQFNPLNAGSKIKNIIEGMDRRTLQNGLPEKCEPPCVATTHATTVLKVKPATVNTRWLASDDGECTNKHFNKSMTATRTFKAPQSSSCKKSVQEKASGWVKDLMVDEESAEIIWNGEKQKTTMVALCPDPCSYFSDQIFDFKESAQGCEVSVTLNVTCSQPRKGFTFEVAGTLNVVKSCEKPE